MESRRDEVARGLASLGRWQDAIIDHGPTSPEASDARPAASRDFADAMGWINPDSIAEQPEWRAFRRHEPAVFDTWIAMERAIKAWHKDRAWVDGLGWPGGDPHTPPWDGTNPPWLLACQRAVDKLTRALGIGPGEFWLPSSRAERLSKRLGKEIDATRIKRWAERGSFPGREVEPGSVFKYEIELGSFVRWFAETFPGEFYNALNEETAHEDTK